MAQQTPHYGTQEQSAQQSTQQPIGGVQSQIAGVGTSPQVGGQQPPLGQQGQQAQYGQQAMGGQQVAGQQPGAGMDVKLEEALTDEMRLALHDFVQSALVCEWCAERCIDEGPQMAECLRLCRDVADLASLNVQLVGRDSVFGPEVAETFAAAAEACAQECAQHPHEHCQECAEVLGRAVRSTRRMLASFGQPQQGIQAQQGQPQQMQPQQGQQTQLQSPMGQQF